MILAHVIYWKPIHTWTQISYWHEFSNKEQVKNIEHRFFDLKSLQMSLDIIAVIHHSMTLTNVHMFCSIQGKSYWTDWYYCPEILPIQLTVQTQMDMKPWRHKWCLEMQEIIIPLKTIFTTDREKYILHQILVSILLVKSDEVRNWLQITEIYTLVCWLEAGKQLNVNGPLATSMKKYRKSDSIDQEINHCTDVSYIKNYYNVRNLLFISGWPQIIQIFRAHLSKFYPSCQKKLTAHARAPRSVWVVMYGQINICQRGPPSTWAWR